MLGMAKFLEFVMTINFVFSGCNESLWEQKNFTVFWNSRLTMFVKVIRLLWEACWAVSSAKSELNKLVHLGKSFIYIRKRRGPRMDPWGTPSNISRSGQKLFLYYFYYIDFSMRQTFKRYSYFLLHVSADTVWSKHLHSFHCLS